MLYHHRPSGRLTAALLLSLCGSPAAAQSAAAPTMPAAGEQRIHAVIAEELARRFAPADRWEIFITASPEELATGYLPKLEARATNLRLPAGEVIAVVGITIEEVRLLLDEQKVDSTGHTVIEAHVRDRDLARIISEKAGKKLRRVKIRFQPNRVTATASVRAGPLSIPLRRRSHPEVRDDAVHAHTYRLEVAGLNLSRRTLRQIDEKINPLIDFKQFRVPIEIEEIEIDQGEMVMRLSADLDAEQEQTLERELEQKQKRRR